MTSDSMAPFVEVHNLDDLNITSPMRKQALRALADVKRNASKVFPVPDEPWLWEAHCQCEIWARGGYDTEANARRALSQHQSRCHPAERG